MPAQGDRPATKHENVITLTTAGMNLLLFSCPDAQALIHWTAAFRLAAYEKSRLEELYTAHLIRMSLSDHGNCAYYELDHQSYEISSYAQGRSPVHH